VVYRLVTEGTVEAKILDKARSKRKLEKLVMEGGAMRALPGQKSLLGKANLTVEDLAHALFSTDAESVRFSKSAEGDIPDPKSLISDDELAYLLDRSFNDRTEGPEGEASKGKGKGKSPAKKGAKASPVRPGAAARFEEVAEGEWRDENGDALADHDAAALGKI
jgi:ATP-dependent DNA helicase